MDITLERVLSLIPKKPDGKYVHGAKKQFADSLGLSHNLVTMWEKGQSQSYKGYLYEISAKYNVSVEWLKGETDEKSTSPLSVDLGDGESKAETVCEKDLSKGEEELIQLFRLLPDDLKAGILAQIEAVLKQRGILE